MNDPRPEDAGGDQALSMLELALQKGSSRDLEALRAEIARDPLAAVEYAETRDLIERMRELQCQPSAGFAARMEGLGDLAMRRRGATQRAKPFDWAWAAAAAAIVFGALCALDPLGLRVRAEPKLAHGQVPVVQPEPAMPYESPAMPSSLAKAMEATERLAPNSALAEAWTRFQESPREERLTEWIAPRNAASYLRLEREFTDTAGLRRDALRDRTLSNAIRGRAEALAVKVVARTQANVTMAARDQALSLRALVACGSSFDTTAASLAVGLQQHLPSLSDGELAMALCALGEAACAFDGCDAAQIAVHGKRLVADVLEVGAETWTRRRPRLLQPQEPAANLAAAGRFLRVAPAFGVDPAEARAVRLLLLAHLEERQRGFGETPDVPTAMRYAFSDLMDAEQLAKVERTLRKWRPESLAPDYLALQQFAASRRPDALGYARWQLEVRKVAALPEPTGTADLAALCLCLMDSLVAADPRDPLAGL